MVTHTHQLDLIEELKLRRWARENYVPADRRERSWHPVVHDEMTKKDGDGHVRLGREIGAGVKVR